MSNPVKDINDVTQNTVFDGRIVLDQPRKGYRFSADALLLVWFSCSDTTDKLCVDLGAGCGIVGIGLLAAAQVERVIAVEVQPKLAAICETNARLNELDRQYEIINIDIRIIFEHMPKRAADLVVANPPFWNAQKGRLPRDEQRRIACHEVLGDLEDWTSTAARLVSNRGRVCMVFAPRRLDELLGALNRSGLGTTRIRLIHPMPDTPAELALIEARRGRPGRLTIEPPLFLKHICGNDTDEARAIYSGAFSDRLKALPDRRRNDAPP